LPPRASIESPPRRSRDRQVPSLRWSASRDSRPLPGAEARSSPRCLEAWPLLLYAVLALLFWGPWVLGAPRSTILAANDIDPSAYLWFFSWWPYALSQGLNPFYTDLIFTPEGYNLAWVTSMPGPSLALAPVSLSLGPEITWNLMSFAAPALSAWTAFLLCRHVTGSGAASLVGGYLFGFSPYMLNQLRGAPQLAFVPLLPLIALVTIRHVQGSMSDRAFVGAMVAALSAELLISTEVLATAVVFGGFAVIAAYLLYPAQRGPLQRTARLVVVALGGTAILTSPFLFYVFFEERTLPGHALTEFPADLLSFVVPGPLVAVAAERVGATSAGWATGASYFGLPLLVLMAVFGWTYRRRRGARLVLVVFLVGAVATLGTALHVGGSTTGIPLPWAGFSELPLLRYAIPLRFSVFAFLPAAVIVAMWLAWRPSKARWALVLAVVVSLVPAVGSSAWHTHLDDLAFFAEGVHERFLDRGDRVLTLPATGRNMRWQVQSEFSFRLAAGYVGAFPQNYARYPAWGALHAATLFGRLGRIRPAELRRFIRAKGVSVIVVDPRVDGPWRRLFRAMGAQPIHTGGVVLYRLEPPPAYE
jgi:hypothetical protein